MAASQTDSDSFTCLWYILNMGVFVGFFFFFFFFLGGGGLTAL